MASSSSNVANTSANSADLDLEGILNGIQSLQELEQKFMEELETTLTAEEKAKLVEKLNQIGNMRTNMYRILQQLNTQYENTLQTANSSLTDQYETIHVIENELNHSRRRLELLEAEKNNKIRLIEVNDYYSDKYEEHSQLMKIIIFTLIPVILLTILSKMGILPSSIYYGLMIIVSLIGAYFFWGKYASIVMRDNMDYNSYEWPFNPETAPKDSGELITDPWGTGSFGTCIGDACCSTGQIFDTTINRCVISTSSSATSATSATSAN